MPQASQLASLYYNADTGLVSFEKFYKRLKDLGYDFKRKEVEEFVRKQYTDQVNRTTKKPKKFSTITAPFNRFSYQLDIMNYNRFELHHYKYILCVIDVHSRYAMCVPLTGMTMEYIMEKLKGIFSTMGLPENINCDLQFNAKLFLEYCDDNDITVHFSDKDEINKNAIVERFHRTLARMLQRWRNSTNQRNWYAVLPNIVANYNSLTHKTIQAKPIEVWNNTDTNKQKIIKVIYNFKIGDMVRIKKKKALMEKGDYITHSKEEYLITDKEKGKLFLLNLDTNKELKRGYKPYELAMANVVQYH